MPFRPAPRYALPLLTAASLSACVAPRGGSPDPVPATPAPPPAVQPVPQPPAAAPSPFAVKPVTPNATESRGGTYRVVSGDTLRRVSDKTGAGSEAIARTNDLHPPFLIRIGQRLKIPAGRWHQVGSGETGIAIARAYGVEWQRIAELNALEEPYILRTGQRLLLPSTTEVDRMSMEERAAAFDLDIDDLITGGEPALAETARPAKPVSTAPRTTPLPATEAVAAAQPFSGRFDWPLQGSIKRGFGSFGSGRRNNGVNIAASMGAPVMAAADGVVAYAGSDLSAYGGLILIRHSDTWTTAYAHASELLVSRGQAVKRGQTIARAGASGHVDGPQLHFEIRQGAKPVDPLAHLPKRR
ncbi:Murein DD-endopeptidase MepM and murein hydrolase activator NlpD, contain LysM domain [Sphingomonas laterariae]|uniref:Murein DD-endopeptidase MepM and murein hydrolase activator NlpD, contain LysM domain n=1 Tax=Edaphosphingomonas laterariae TaxID=861865 RepID=A0A239H6Q9_9SPHN|nr:M23 family metallopeptidase [Sphingomonas laterariae]SNS77077.1 Murein DD-endopeptidase MepM and murein hydrolase activator NlpD, contain LysM domain [Sphingomonas laterariae]